MVQKKPIKEYQLDIGKVTVFDDYMIAELKDGFTLTLEKTYDLIAISEIHFRDKNFAYITIRKNSYSIDPTLYTHIKELSNLKAFAIVSNKEIDKHNYHIEKYFYGKKMMLFEELHEAVIWAKNVVNQ